MIDYCLQANNNYHSKLYSHKLLMSLDLDLPEKRNIHIYMAQSNTPYSFVVL